MSDANRPKPNNKRTLDIAPNMGEMVKPAELIEVKGSAKLTLADRRLFNVLLRQAFGPDLASENRRFEIPLADLRETHDSNDRLVRSIEALMTTVVTIQRPDGSTDRVQLLGWNNLSDPKRKRGNLKYSIPPELALLLKDSTVFAKLELEVLRSFTSKYALALYEAVAAVYIAQTYGIELGLGETLIVLLTATLSAIGAAGIPEAGLVTMIIVLKAVDLPIEGVSLILVIDWFLDRCRTTINVWGDSVGAAVIDRLEDDQEQT